MVTSYLSDELHTEVKISRLEILTYRTLGVYGILLRDQQFDTLLSSESIKIRFKNMRYLKGEFQLSELELKNPDFRLRKYPGSESSNLTALLKYFAAGDTVIKKTKSFELSLKSLSVLNGRFLFDDQNRPPETDKIDFSHPGIAQLNLSASNLSYRGDTLSLQINHLSLNEKSGFVIDSLSCRFKMGSSFLEASDLKLLTPKNSIDLDVLFSFTSFKDFNEFLTNVKIRTTIRPSAINLAEVGYFAPVMYTMDNPIKLVGKISGTVSNFKAKDFRFAFGRTTRFKGDIQMTGLPDFTETFHHFSIEELITEAGDVNTFRIPGRTEPLSLPELVSELGTTRIEGKFTGFYNDFVSYARFNTALGNLQTDLLLRMNKQNRVEYNGKLAAQRFNAGKLLNLGDKLNKLDLKATVKGSGLDFDRMKVYMDGRIDSLEFYGNVFNEIAIDGELDNKKFTGHLEVFDDLGTLAFTGSLDYSESIPEYNFNARIQHAKLNLLHLINRDSSAMLSTNMNINFLGSNLDNMQGIILLDSTLYTESGNQYFLQDLTLSITRDASQFGIIRLYSDALDATVEGNFKLRSVPGQIISLVNVYLDTLITDIDNVYITSEDHDFIFDIQLKDTKILSDLFIPELEVSSGTTLSGGYNSRIRNLFFDTFSPDIVWKGYKLNNCFAEFFIKEDYIYLKAGTENLFLNDTLKVDSLMLATYTRHNNVKFNVTWQDLGNTSFSRGDLSGNLNFSGINRYQLNFDNANIVFADTLWQIQPSNFIRVDTGEILFSNLGFRSKMQEILIYGVISHNPEDTLTIGFRDFNLSNFDLLLENLNIDLDGIVDGNLQLVEAYQTPFYLADLRLNGFHLNGENFGDAEIRTLWDPLANALNIRSDFIYTGNIGKRKIVGIDGRYFPHDPHNNFDIDVSLDKFRISALEPILSSFSSEIDGLASGELKITGIRDDPIIKGSVDLMHVSMLIDYLNVRYYFADNIRFDNNSFYFSNLVIRDSLNNQAICSGVFSHERLKDFNIDLELTTSNLAGLNTTRGKNSIFYGQAMASGEVRIHGPLNNLVMDLALRSEKGTNVKIPVSYGTEVAENHFILFVNNTEEEINSPVRDYEADLSGLQLNINLDVTNDAELQLFMPYQMGNIRTRGTGNFIMNIPPDGNMTMDGEYVIDRGSFFMTLQNIINRDFTIRRGSRVSWKGDPYDAQVNLKAVYRVKTKLGEYGPQQDSSIRVPVDCIIALSNRLLDPQIKFTIEFPDLSDDTKQYVYARLDTNDQAMMSQQMISLLVLNSFYQGGGYTGSVGLNTFSIFTNQINNWLSSVSNDFDIGVNYRPADSRNSQEVEVALSTQLWDDRVMIDGNVGYRETSNTKNTNNIVGEVTVEVKITNDGKLRAKAFNRSNNDLIYKNYAPYTQGVGIFYEFNRISLRNLFGQRNEKEEKPEPADQTLLK